MSLPKHVVDLGNNTQDKLTRLSRIKAEIDLIKEKVNSLNILLTKREQEHAVAQTEYSDAFHLYREALDIHHAEQIQQTQG